MAKIQNIRVGMNVKVKKALKYPQNNQEYCGVIGAVIAIDTTEFEEEDLTVLVRFSGDSKWYSRKDLKLA